MEAMKTTKTLLTETISTMDDLRDAVQDRLTEVIQARDEDDNDGYGRPNFGYNPDQANESIELLTRMLDLFPAQEPLTALYAETEVE